MKTRSIYQLVATLILFTLIFSGCGALQSAAPTEVDSTTPPLPTDIPIEVSIDLAGPQVGSSMVWVDNSLLVYVPGGDFTMGAGGQDNPAHNVSLSPFWIYRTEVTNRMYALCIANGQCSVPLDKQAAADLDKLSFRENPVVGIDWQQASDYCTWVNGRLPTEAEWELTARGPQSNIFPWGDSAPACDLTNFKDCIGSSARVYDYPAGKSYYDAMNLTGNIYEWVGDFYRTKYYSESPTQDPPGPDSGTNKVVRGGSFGTDKVELASAKRSNFDPAKTRPDLGFRCVVPSPVFYPSFCEASAFVADIDPEKVPPSGGSCEISAKTRAPGCGIVTADVSGGTITDVSASIFACSPASNTRVFCSGPAAGSDSVTICGTCDSSNNGVPPEIGLSTCGRSFTALTNVPGGASQCNYQGGPPQDGCPSDMLENSDGTCSQPVGEPNRCPVGMYLDENRMCTSVNEQEQGCTAGYTYDSQAGCCSGASYPGCGPGEVETPYGCVLSQPSTESSNTSCVTLTLDTGECYSGGNRDPEAPEAPGTPSCSVTCGYCKILNMSTCSCEPDPDPKCG